MLHAVLEKLSAIRHIAAPAAVAFAALAAMPAQASQTALLIWPVSPVIQSNERAEALWLENTGKKPMSLQIRVFSWAQSNYTNLFDQQRIVIPSPPMARIEPGKKQLVRLIRATPVQPNTEQAFRVQIDEVPIPEVERTTVNGLGVLMRYSIPLYVYGDGLVYAVPKQAKGAEAPANTGEPQLTWQIVDVQGRKHIEIANSGPVHAQLSRGFFTLAGSGKQIELSKAGVGTVLAHSRMRWPLPAGVDGGAVLTMKVNRSKENLVISKAR